MQTSAKGIALIKNFEGLRLQAYQDSVGVWTIGFGSTHGVYKGMSITQEQAEQFLKRDLVQFEDCVSRLVKSPIGQNQFDALVSFSYNLGCSNLASSTLLKKLNAGDYAGAASEFTRWTRAGGVVLQGLVKRRNAEKALFEQP